MTSNQDSGPNLVDTSQKGSEQRAKRSWRSRLLELLLWTAVAILTAVLLTMLSERVLPPNF